ncbi:MAG TPA: aldo/keto reductase [Bacillales bacterium]|nr:aldo/keto reductase [Bacillales bacterium]
MVKSITDITPLHNGVKMPWFGLGVWQVANNEEVVTAVKSALDIGYRSIDTAAAYRNEEGVGKAIKESGVAREDIFLTSKLWNDDQGYESTLQAFEDSLRRLETDYLDLYLIHWPVEGKYKDSWRAMEELYEAGKIRAIGLSNFHAHHIKDILADAKVRPMVDQLEFHPLLIQEELREFCKAEQIQMEAWSPLAHGKLLEDPTLKEIGEKYGKTPAQVMIRWDLDHGVVTIPKSSNPDRIKQNSEVFDFELTSEDLAKIDALNRNERTGADPDNFDF